MSVFFFFEKGVLKLLFGRFGSMFIQEIDHGGISVLHDETVLIIGLEYEPRSQKMTH